MTRKSNFGQFVLCTIYFSLDRHSYIKARCGAFLYIKSNGYGLHAAARRLELWKV